MLIRCGRFCGGTVGEPYPYAAMLAVSTRNKGKTFRDFLALRFPTTVFLFSENELADRLLLADSSRNREPHPRSFFCTSKAIPEVTLLQITDDIPFDEIIADDDNTLYVHYRDSEMVLHWKDRSRSESWTAEMRKEAGAKTIQRRNRECQQPVL